MISVGTRDELKRAIAKAEDTIAVDDPKLCYDFMALRGMSIHDRRLLYLLERRGYQMMAKRMLGYVEVKFVLDSATAS